MIFRLFTGFCRVFLQMRLTPDDATLITCSNDGCICVWNVKSAKEKIMPVNIRFGDNSLISSKQLNGMIKSEAEALLKHISLMKQFKNEEIKFMEAHEKQTAELNRIHSLKLKRLEKEEQVRLDSRVTDTDLGRVAWEFVRLVHVRKQRRAQGKEVRGDILPLLTINVFLYRFIIENIQNIK